MANEIVKIAKEQGLDKSGLSSLVEAFGGPFEEVGEILADYKEIEVTSEDQTDDMAKAREKRLSLKQARVTVENKRKELKADILKQGRAIDGVANYVKSEIKPAEEYLQLQEDFIKIKEEKEAAELKSKRTEQLLEYTDDVSIYGLDDMTVDQFDTLLASLKQQQESKLQAEKEAEEKRKAEEEAERKRQIEIEKENKRLKKEADQRAAELEKERKVQADREAKLKAEADKKLEAERAKREAIESQQREQAEAERKKKAEAEEADIKALLAPDKEKLLTFAQAIETIRDTKLPAVKSKKAQDIVNEIEGGLSELSETIINKAKEL